MINLIVKVGRAVCRKYGIFIFLFTNPFLLYSQQTVQTLNGVDFGVFESDSTFYKVEVYFNFPKWKIPYKAVKPNLFTTSLKLSLKAEASTGKVFETQSQLDSNDDSSRILTSTLLGSMRLKVIDGEYKFTLTAENQDGRYKAKTERVIKVGNPRSKLRLSSLISAFSIESSKNINSPFYKNNLEVIPNPESAYGNGLDTAFFYAELYGIKSANIVGEKIYQSIFLTRAGKKLEETEVKKVRSRLYDAVVFKESMFVGDLLSGSYDFVVTLEDSSKQKIAESKKRIFVTNPVTTIKRKRISDSFLEPEFARLSEEELDEMRSQVKAIITEDEAKAYETLTTLDSKKFFFQRFWEARGGVTKVREFVTLIGETKWWGSSFRKGYETDRGKILLKYGRPTNVEVFSQESNTRAHEIWTYENFPGRGRVSFVFGDVRGTGEFELLHSDVPTEAFNQNWRLRLQSTQSGAGSNFMR
ncbi:MAG: GWxTD domain-containing protein [Chloroherpetonaceae bacterium]|nr:GWxTD domain-containing protein [Chloroherpetonaceae bacterium]